LGREQSHAKFNPATEENRILSPAKKAKAKAKKTTVRKSAKKPVRAQKKPNKKAGKKPGKKPAKAKAKSQAKARPAPETDLLRRIKTSLEDDKAEDIVTINLAERSSLCDWVVIASGRSSRHVISIAEHLARRLKEEGYGGRPVSGAAQGDWVLVDAGDVIVHVFRPEVRDYYDLEGMWSVQ
jgi:ribosome silencing factor RsfS/YbeB/iojap